MTLHIKKKKNKIKNWQKKKKENKKEKKEKEIINLIKKNPNNTDIILSNINFPIILNYINTDLFKDATFCFEVLHRNGMALKYMPENIKNDKVFVFFAVSSNGFSLQFASNELRADYDIVSEAILKYKTPLKYASENLQLYFKDKWEKYYAIHHENKWTGYEITHNGIFTSEEIMKEIYEMQEAKNKKKKKEKQNDEFDTELDSESEEILEYEQIILDDFSFEENDID